MDGPKTNVFKFYNGAFFGDELAMKYVKHNGLLGKADWPSLSPPGNKLEYWVRKKLEIADGSIQIVAVPDVNWPQCWSVAKKLEHEMKRVAIDLEVAYM